MVESAWIVEAGASNGGGGERVSISAAANIELQRGGCCSVGH